MADMVQFLTRVTEEQYRLIESTYLANPQLYESRAAVVRAALDRFYGLDKHTYRSIGYAWTCKFGHNDCVNDPAYLKYAGYKGMVGSCDCCKEGECYDDEDK